MPHAELYPVADPEPDPDPVETVSDWAPISLLELALEMRSGDYVPTRPVILEVDGAAALFYAERINQLFGESSAGKSWIAYAAILEVVRQGGRVLLVDYEDSPTGTVERLVLSLGMTDAELELVDYRRPDSGVGRGLDWFSIEHGHKYELVVFDSTGEAMAAGGIDPNNDPEVAVWFHKVRQLQSVLGQPAVLIIDHVPKDPNAPRLYAINSQRKRAAIDGASYRADVILPFAKGKDGKVKLTTAKDRPGTRAQGSVAAEVEFTSGPDGALSVTLRRSELEASNADGRPFRPTVYMERVSRWLENNPQATQRGILGGVDGADKYVKQALGVLIAEHRVKVTAGERGAQYHEVVTPFREVDEQGAGVAERAAAAHGTDVQGEPEF